MMRGVGLFIAGTLVGLAVHAAVAQNSSLSPNKGVVGVNHVGIAVPDVNKAVEYYTKVMGYPEAFRQMDAQGNIALVYVQVSKGTFIEIQPANAQRPPGISHFGVVVENMKDATAMFKARGAPVGPINVSGTKAILSNIADPNGVRTELVEITPDSLHRKAMDRWK
jgi:catechol 2,3-dioxygenase-like lactoylglutathione lyase family enzyme